MRLGCLGVSNPAHVIITSECGQGDNTDNTASSANELSAQNPELRLVFSMIPDTGESLGSESGERPPQILSEAEITPRLRN